MQTSSHNITTTATHLQQGSTTACSTASDNLHVSLPWNRPTQRREVTSVPQSSTNPNLTSTHTTVPCNLDPTHEHRSWRLTTASSSGQSISMTQTPIWSISTNQVSQSKITQRFKKCTVRGQVKTARKKRKKRAKIAPWRWHSMNKYVRWGEGGQETESSRMIWGVRIRSSSPRSPWNKSFNNRSEIRASLNSSHESTWQIFRNKILNLSNERMMIVRLKTRMILKEAQSALQSDFQGKFN